jgi:uncharacterized membrane-anchored protein
MEQVATSRQARPLLVCLLAVSCLLHIAVKPAHAQDTDSPSHNGIVWQKGPVVADLGGNAQVTIPDGFAFTDGNGTRRFLELSKNPSSGNEVGLIVPVPKPGTDGPEWYMIFEFHEVGYITDNDRASLDADALLASIQKDTEKANEIRRQRGWPPFHVVSWSERPFYDPQSHNLTWAVLGQGDTAGSEAVNYSVRILGRKGTMSVDLVLDPKDLRDVLPNYSRLLGGFNYSNGNRYADFIRGDKVAGYGLTALIAGGVGAAAVKTGLLAKLWKVMIAAFAAIWKLIVFLFAALLALLRRVVGKIKSIFRPKRTPLAPGTAVKAELAQPTENNS